MAKYRQKSPVYFSRLKLLARKFISGRAWKPTDKLFPAEVDTYAPGDAPKVALSVGAASRSR
ncbi:MAG: hypothetical protein V7L22_20440 [Nostoc sp.]|uniref:hypothetical protein n=1 Tax=Nostoc sp. TaxID=1180 RepID=UPI002FFB546C